MCSADFVGIVHVHKLEPLIDYRKSFVAQSKQIWKTTNTRTPVTVIETGKDSAMCGVDLAADTDYLLTGSLGHTGKLRVNLCGSLVRKVSSLDEQLLKELRDISDTCTNSLTSDI